MAERGSASAFEDAVLPHLDAAYTLARWLMRHEQDAQDVVQESLVRALQYFPGFRGGNARGWLLQIVRNAAYASMNLNRGAKLIPLAGPEAEDPLLRDLADPGDDPEAALMKSQGRRRLGDVLARLPAELREVFVLRELQELAYKDIAQIADIPVGTVMSRLFRARRLLAAALRAGEPAQ